MLSKNLFLKTLFVQFIEQPWIAVWISFHSSMYIVFYLISVAQSRWNPPSWASYQIRKIAGCSYARNAGNVIPATDLKGNHQLAFPACITAHVWPLSDKKPMGFLSDSGHAHAVMHAGITKLRWQGKRSRHSGCMRNPQYYISGKRPMEVHSQWRVFWLHGNIRSQGISSHRISLICMEHSFPIMGSVDYDKCNARYEVIFLNPWIHWVGRLCDFYANIFLASVYTWLISYVMHG